MPRRKYTTKQLMLMTNKERESICRCNCETKYCPFKKSLWKYREDGWCIAETYLHSKAWIEEDNQEISDILNDAKLEISRAKLRIKRYKALQKTINKELHKDEVH